MTPASSATVSMIIGQPISALPGDRAGSEQERGSESNGAFERLLASGQDNEAARSENKGPEGAASEPSEVRQAEAGARRIDRDASALHPTDPQDAADKTLSDVAIPAFAVPATKGAEAQAADRPVQASAVASASPAAGATDATPREANAPRAAAVSIATPVAVTIERPGEPLGTTSADGMKATAKPAAAPQIRQEPVAPVNVALSLSPQPRAVEAVQPAAASPVAAGAVVEGEPVASETTSRSVAQDGASAAKVTVSVSVQPRDANPAPQAPQLREGSGAELRPNSIKTETSSADIDPVDRAEPPVGPRGQAEPFKSSSAAKAFVPNLGQRNSVGPNPLAVDLREATVSDIDLAAPADWTQAVRGAGLRPMSITMGAVAIQIQNQVEILANGRTVHVRLDPPNLGSFEVRLELSGTAVQAVVASDRADTLELLARHRSELIEILTDAGFDVLDARFERGGESPSDVEDEELLSVGTPAVTEEAAPSPSHWIPGSWVDSSGRLDIRA